MIKNYLSIYVVLLLGIYYTTSIQAPQLTINSNGIHKLGTGISYTATASGDSIILITANHVTLDLGGQFISQSNITSVTGVNGITVAQGVTNPTITNGHISNVTGTGIVVGAGTSQVIINGIEITNCGATGVALLGSTASPISTVSVSNCDVLSSATGTFGTFGFYATQCTSLVYQNLRVNNGGTSVNNCTAYSFDTINTGFFTQCRAANNIGGLLSIGFDMEGCSGCIADSCVVRGQTSSSVSGTALGFLFGTSSTTSTTSLDNIFSNCSALLTTATNTNGTVYGFMISASCNDNLLIGCKSLSGTSYNACAGYRFVNNQRNTATDCIALKNTSGVTGNGTGYIIDTCIGVKCLRCIGSENISQAGFNAVGFDILNGSIECLVQDSVAMRNDAGSPTVIANSFGCRMSTASVGNGCYFLRNACIRNGTTREIK